MKLVILGATGATGQHVVEHALSQGHDVVAVVRDPAKVTARPRLTVVKGDVTTTADLEPVLRGSDAVIGTLGPRSKSDPICADAASAVVAAMKQAGVKRVVWTSASGVGDSRGPVNAASFVFGRIIIPLLLRVPYANHAKAEETMRASGLDWTVVRPLELVDASTGREVTANLGDRKLEGLKIARRDLARYLIAEAVQPKHLHQMPMLHA